MFAIELARGLYTTWREMFNKPVTIQYPDQRQPVYRRFKGRHSLHRYDNGLETVSYTHLTLPTSDLV